MDRRAGKVLPLQREPDNPADRFAVVIIRHRSVVSHLPFSLALVVAAFLSRGVKKALVEVTGTKVNRGAGYGIEILCKYRF